MTHKPIIQRTREAVLREGAILCIRLSGDAPALDACRAAARGGLRVFEITLTTPGALTIIESLSRDSDLIVGAGTVLDPDDVRRVAQAGGRFVLSPVFDPRVVDEASVMDMLGVPGASTPKEILTAHRHGAEMVKVFPAGALGGPAYLKAIRGPLPDIPLIPTNGPTAETLGDYFKAGAVAVGVGGEVFPEGWTPESVETAARRIRAALDVISS